MIVAWAIYLLWAILTIGWLAVMVYQLTKKRFCKLNLFLPIPIITLTIFSYVFIFNRGSNVAQLSESHSLWSLWYECYFPLFFGNTIGAIAFLVTLIIPVFWRKSENWEDWPFKLIMTLSMGMSVIFILMTMPDA